VLDEGSADPYLGRRQVAMIVAGDGELSSGVKSRGESDRWRGRGREMGEAFSSGAHMWQIGWRNMWDSGGQGSGRNRAVVGGAVATWRRARGRKGQRP
jgi:hypothetical protein